MEAGRQWLTQHKGPRDPVKDPADPRTDEELVALCNAGSAGQAAAAFEALYRRHRAFVFRVALKFVGDHDAALDVLQETFGYLLRKFPPTGEGLTLTARLETLLYPVAKHRALDVLRRQRREVPFDWEDRHAAHDDSALADGTPSHAGRTAGDTASVVGALTQTEADHTEAALDTDLVAAALAGLSPLHREALTLRFVEGLTLAEIAAALDVPLGTVKSRLSLGVRQLREDPRVKALFDL